MITITIPEKTPTINHLYGQRKSGFGQTRFLKKEAIELRERIFGYVQEAIKDFPMDMLEGHKLSVEVSIFENWLTKKSEIKKKDLLNREKFLIDSVFAALDIDDRFIYYYATKKIQSEEEKAVITIKAIS